MISRDDISLRYCFGSGVEIGPGTAPTQIHSDAQVVYVDKRSEEELKRYFKSETITVGSSLGSFDKASFDFMIAHHVLEHCSNVLDTLVEWIGYLKAGGTLYLSVPCRQHSDDRLRLVTPPTHFLSDYVLGITDSSFESREHIYSFLWGWLDTGGLRGTTKQEAGALAHCAAHKEENDLHWHIFTFQTFKFAIRLAASLAGQDVAFLHEEDAWEQGGPEHRIVARLSPAREIDADAAYLLGLRQQLPLRLTQIALDRLEGAAIHGYSQRDAGKVFTVQERQLRWIRDPAALAELGLAGKETVYLEASGLGNGIYGGEIFSASAALGMNRKQAVIDRIPLQSGHGLELSPGAHPLVTKEEADITYCDIVDNEEYSKRYSQSLGPKIDRVLGTQPLDKVFRNEYFDYLVSSHVMEHIPDFINFFISARNILRPGGKIVKLIPDRRYTFDVLRADTTIGEIEEAYRLRLKRPSRRMIADHYYHADTNANAPDIWSGEYQPRPNHSPEQARQLTAECDLATMDCHCFTFTPESFRTLINYVIERYVPSLKLVEIVDTPVDKNEFLVHLAVDA